MAQTYTSVVVEGPNQTRHWATSNEGQGSRGISFLGDGPHVDVELEAWGLFIDFTLTRAGQRLAAVKAGEGRKTWLVKDDGTVITLPGTEGNWAHAFRPGADEIYLQQDQSGELFVYNFAGTFLRREPMAYDSADGIHHCEPDGRPVRGTSMRPGRTFAGKKLWFSEEIAGFAAGQAGVGVDGGIAFVVGATDEAWMWPYYTPHRARLSVIAGVPYVSISAAAPPAPNAIPWQPYDELPPIVIPRTLRPIYRGALGGPVTAPGNVGFGLDPTRLIVESEGKYSDGRPYVPAGSHNRWAVIFLSPQESHDWDKELREAKARARQTGGALGFYSDRAWFHPDVLAMCLHARSEGYGVLPLVRAYPSGPTDSEDAVEGRMWESCRDLKAAGFDRVGVVRPIYTQSGYWPLPMEARCNLAITRSLEQESMCHVMIDLAFGWDRPPVAPWNQSYHSTLCAATPMPTRDLLPTTTITPIDCQLSGWIPGEWTTVSETLERQHWTRTILVSPAHGGQACGSLERFEERPRPRTSGHGGTAAPISRKQKQIAGAAAAGAGILAALGKIFHWW